MLLKGTIVGFVMTEELISTKAIKNVGN